MPRRARVIAQAPNVPPDFSHGFSPEDSSYYDEVRVFSFGPIRHEGSLLTLLPVNGGDRAFKMSVTSSQADSIRAALRGRDGRPGSHDMFKGALRALGAFVTKVAVTHIQDEVFVARVWMKGKDGEVHVDSRPSDAIAMALRSCAPIYLHCGLLKLWSVSVESVRRDDENGVCECVGDLPDRVKSTSSLVKEVQKGSKEHLTLAKLKCELDLMVRLERFAEAEELKRRIEGICPLEKLELELRKALEEERYVDAGKLRDRITIWRARVRMWERGKIDLETFEEIEEDY